MRFCVSYSRLGGAYEEAYFWLVCYSAGMGDDHSRMRLRPTRRLPTENIPCLHVSGIGIGRAAQCAAGASNSGSGVVKQRRDSSGVNGFRFVRRSEGSGLTRQGRPSTMLWRMVSSIDNPVRRAALLKSSSRSDGMVNGNVLVFTK